MQPEFYREVIESTRCGILTIDEEGQVTTMNHLAKQILNLPAIASRKVPCQEFLKDHPSICRILLDSLGMENPPSRIEVDIKAPGRPRRVIGGTISHIRREDGTRGGAVLFFKDLTHLEQKEEQERLKERLAAIGEMAAGLAHEIRNPLGNIGSTASLLKRKLNGNDSGILALNNIVQEVRRLNQTVTQCLEYAKPLHLKPRTVNLPVLVQEAIQEVRAGRPGSQIRVVQDLPEGNLEVVADGFQLRQVFHNLVANAYDAMGVTGTLEVSMGLEVSDRGAAGGSALADPEPPRYAVVRFRDSGRGIAPEVRERLFFPFFTTKPGGSGIGLAVAKKIIDSHRGVIDVESEPGAGATFSVKLPYPGPEDAN
jgi:PAS domain S-box-containing protein